MASALSLTTHQKLAIFTRCFSGLPDVYGTYDPQTGRARQVKEPVTDDVLLRHLKGQQPYGVYLLCGDRVRAAAVDFDEENTWYPLCFYRQAKHTEIFPKHDRLGGNATFGNYINAPLFRSMVPSGRTVFVNPQDAFMPYGDQWKLLAGVERVSEKKLDDIIELNELDQPQVACPSHPVAGRGLASPSAYGLPPCAQRMLAEGVTENQRVACFRLAVQLRKVGLPPDVTVAALMTWSAKNQPRGGKGVITDEEVVGQVEWAYAREYRSCGCEDPAVMPYCSPNCPLLAKRNTGPRHAEPVGHGRASA